VFGLGFGVTQNATQTLMYNRVAESGYGAVSAMWNLAYDGGMGLGTAGFGVLVVYTGYSVAFVLTAALLLTALLLTALLLTALLPTALLPTAVAAARRGRGRRLGGAGARTTDRSG
jgi:predicted MFS family arabinose efflux permease